MAATRQLKRMIEYKKSFLQEQDFVGLLSGGCPAAAGLLGAVDMRFYCIRFPSHVMLTSSIQAVPRIGPDTRAWTSTMAVPGHWNSCSTSFQRLAPVSCSVLTFSGWIRRVIEPAVRSVFTQARRR